MKCQTLFSQKKKGKKNRMSSAVILNDALMVKCFSRLMGFCIFYKYLYLRVKLTERERVKLTQNDVEYG